MKRWQNVIDRLKESQDWEAAASLWDAREAAKLTDTERQAIASAADRFDVEVAAARGREDLVSLWGGHAEALRGLLKRLD